MFGINHFARVALLPGLRFLMYVVGVVMRVTQRRIDDQIIALCGKVTQASDGELEFILQELMRLLHQKIERLERRAASVFLNFEGFYERRITNVNTQVPNSSKTSDAA